MSRTPKIVIEFHYRDGDVGAHPATPAETALWKGFSSARHHQPTHILLRPDTTTGQALSTQLHQAPALLKALQAMRTAYGRLHDGLSDMIEGGRLTEADIPDDYQWLVKQLAGPANLADEHARRLLESSPSPSRRRTPTRRPSPRRPRS